MDGVSTDHVDAWAVRERAHLLYSGAEVSAAIGRMAREITVTLAHTRPVLLAVMHGGVFTAVELCRHLELPYEFDYVHATRYGAALTGGDLEWHVKPRATLAGRTVLVVDDILDRGVTLQALHEELRTLGVTDLYTAALVVKRLAPPVDRPRVDFSGLEVDDVYVFGSGMDYKGYWRGLAGLYAARP